MMAVSKASSRPRMSFPSALAWREWLEVNHIDSEGVWVVFLKSARGPQPLSQREALEEALCYGWIDSQMRPLDGDHFIKLFTPRRPGSVWSQTNLNLARELIAEGRMAPSGERAIDWEQEGWEKEFDTVPSDLFDALRLNSKAWSAFESMPEGKRRIHVHWVVDAKKEETRRKRVNELVRLLASGRWLGIEYLKKRDSEGPGKA